MEDFNMDEIYHHGVKGMKWGVRRTPVQLGHKPKVRKPVMPKKKAEPAKPKKKLVSEMTNQELNEAINRRRLEKQYMELYPAQVSAGKKFVKKVMNDVVIPSATSSAKNAATKYMNKYLDQKLGLSDNDPMKKMEKVVKDMNTRKQYEELSDYFDKKKK